MAASAYRFMRRERRGNISKGKRANKKVSSFMAKKNTLKGKTL